MITLPARTNDDLERQLHLLKNRPACQECGLPAFQFVTYNQENTVAGGYYEYDTFWCSKHKPSWQDLPLYSTKSLIREGVIGHTPAWFGVWWKPWTWFNTGLVASETLAPFGIKCEWLVGRERENGPLPQQLEHRVALARSLEPVENDEEANNVK